MSPITSLHQENTFPYPTSTTSFSFYSPSPTPYDHIAPYQSTQSPSDIIQTITFGTLGILFAIASFLVGYLQLRHMYRPPAMPFHALELPVRNNGRPLSTEIEVQPSVEPGRMEMLSDGRIEESGAESVNDIRAVNEAQDG